MDERRDLVDREELRGEMLLAGYPNKGEWETILDAMPSVEQPVGMTRDDVLAALDAAEARGDKAVVEVLPNYTGEWEEMFRSSVERWANPEVPRLNVRVRVTEQAPEWVPLTQLVGRTIDKCDEEVQGYASDAPLSWRNKKWQWFPFPEGTLNLETGQVAVRPKAPT